MMALERHMSTAAAPHGEGPIGPRYTLDDLLEYVVAQDGSDLHITGGSPPVVLSTR